MDTLQKANLAGEKNMGCVSFTSFFDRASYFCTSFFEAVHGALERINFDAYDDVEVDRRGGLGDEVVPKIILLGLLITQKLFHSSQVALKATRFVTKCMVFLVFFIIFPSQNHR